ncbi:MAG: hypothetical protein FJ026_18500, partial [Chloroflexi bacterium]|nr:hypothetical protein [Chloroflexota bacterium]
MKIYFAGPLFTPYVRQFISAHAQILREHGIDPFVPHEAVQPAVTPDIVDRLLKQGLLHPQDLTEQSAAPSAALRGRFADDLVTELVRRGALTRAQVGLPPLTPATIFAKDCEGLSSANAVVALLDGTQVDDGTACEIGIFYGLLRQDRRKKGIAGWMTDFRGTRRADRGWGINLFVLGVIEECGQIFASFEGVLKQLKTWKRELEEA